MYSQHTFAFSDEDVVWGWVENPYRQLFCGEIWFQHQPPIKKLKTVVCRVYRNVERKLDAMPDTLAAQAARISERPAAGARHAA